MSEFKTFHIAIPAGPASLADSCDWNPEEDRMALRGEHHAAVEVIVGATGQWRLCASCAALPEFDRYRVRREVKAEVALPRSDEGIRGPASDTPLSEVRFPRGPSGVSRRER